MSAEGDVMNATGEAAAASEVPLPPSLQEIADDFADTPESQRLELLLEFSDELPDLPARLADNPDLLEPVPECQSPIFVLVEVERGNGAPGAVQAEPGDAQAEAESGQAGTDDGLADGTVHLFFSAPQEAPTTRGFAGILAEGLDAKSVAEVLGTPADLPLRLSITDLVSPLRLNGMSGMLARIQRQVREKA